jgi:hypothetical protein
MESYERCQTSQSYSGRILELTSIGVSLSVLDADTIRIEDREQELPITTKREIRICD